MTNVVVSEVLCYLQNYLGKIPRALLCTSISGFYDEAEIVEAKNILFTTVGNMNLGLDDIPRNRQRRAGDSKSKLDTDDMIALFEYLDLKQVLLPDFVAKRLHRIPNADTSDADVCKLADTVSDVKTQLKNVQMILKTMSENQTSIVETVGAITEKVNGKQVPMHSRLDKEQVAVRTTTSTDEVSMPALRNHGQVGDSTNDENVASKSFTDMFENSDEAASWFPVKAVKKPSSRPIRKIVGANRATDQKVKAVTGTDQWHIFAGRLEPTTTEAEMISMLSGSNIKVASCQLLQKKEQWQHKYAAFRIVVDIRDKDNVFNEVIWPAGADVRDWWFKSKQ